MRKGQKMNTEKKWQNDEYYSPAERVGHLLAQELNRNPHFYFFSPDETTSNKFSEVFEVEKRAWGDLPQKKWDLPEDANGRIVEMLSENVLFSAMTGHLANNEPAMMGSYEAFFSIITSQILQQMKFIKQSKKVSWRTPLPAVNLLSTSTCWRQDHNGFTHQSPALISTLLSVPSNLANCLFPVDDNAAEAAFDFMLSSKDVVNFTTFNKIELPRYLDQHQAKTQLNDNGAMILDFISDDDPDVVFVSAGDIMAKEMIEAIKILKNDLPQIRIRLINVAALSYRAIGTTKNKLSKREFEDLFTKDKPIIANFHGYPETFENILENYTARERLRVHGFNEEGSTTTPFEMLRRNAASRYNIAADVAKYYKRKDLASGYYDILEKNHLHAVQFGEDMIE